DVGILTAVARAEQRAERAMLLNRFRHTCEQRHELRRLLKAMREIREALLTLTSLERLHVEKRRRPHRIEHAPHIGDHDVGAAIGERGREKSGDFLVQRIAIAKHQLQRIGSDRGDIERLDQAIEAVAKNFIAHWSGEPHVCRNAKRVANSSAVSTSNSANLVVVRRNNVCAHAFSLPSSSSVPFPRSLRSWEPSSTRKASRSPRGSLHSRSN